MEKRRMEILAPAGNFDALVAAVTCGANAVYLGGKGLNARRSAGNFDREELRRAVEYCHARDVKVYQTVNILMYDEELEEAVEAVRTAAELGVDALLVQDMAIYEIARRCAPQLPLHASTQMSIHNLAGAQEAQRMGFSRAVLARELSREEIRRIAQGTDIELEVFVHGALCMSVSGQCYLSSMIGERSGNRGLCAQPCRLPFQAKGGVEYGLSLKDLALADRVGELRDCGVVSLKIEGRMKRPEYVAAAVTAMKNALAGVRVDFDTLRSVFSRSGFTTGYFDARPDQTMFGVRGKEDVLSAQGVLKDLARLYDREQPLVPIAMELTAQAGQPMELTVTDRAGNRVTVMGEEPQAAINRPTDPERAAQSLQKTGGTPYRAETVDCTIGEGLMLPASALNALRREALEELTARRQILHSYPFADVVERELVRRPQTGRPALYARIRGEQLTEEVADSCAKLILPVGDLPALLARGMVEPSKLVAEIPRILFDGERQMVEQLRALKAKGVPAAWCGNLGALALAREAGMEAMGGWSLNIFNSHALDHYADAGLTEAEVSFELNLQKIRRLGDSLPIGVVAYGYLPLMALRNCPIRAAVGCAKCRGYETLTDRKNVRFAVQCQDKKYSELFNSVPLWLADRMDELAGLDFVTLYFTKESREECCQVTQAYRESRPWPGERTGMTRGLYYRNVQ